MFPRHYKVLGIVLLVQSISACTQSDSSFEAAIRNARQKDLLEVRPVAAGVPYFAPHTLDPVWELSAPDSIVTIPKIRLTDMNGRIQTEDLFDGKTTVVSFFFASCAGFCPALIKNIQRAEKRLSGFPALQFIALTVDPERDSSSQLKEYAQRMQLDPKRWNLFTGDKQAIWRLARETFAAETFRLPVSKGQIAHSEHCFVIDSQRRLRGVLKATRLDLSDRLHALLQAMNTRQAQSSQ